MDSTDSQANDTIDLVNIIRPLLGRWKLLLVCMVLGGIIGFVIARNIPKTYQSTATLYVKQGGGGASALLQSLPISLGTSSAGSSGYYQTLLQSDTMSRTVITKLGLRRNPKFTHGRPMSMENAMRHLKKQVSVKEAKAGGISLVVQAPDPYLAAKIGNEMLDVLGTLVVSSSERKVDFISSKLKETDSELHKAEEETGAFMQTYNIAEIDSQVRAMVDQVSMLDGQLLSLDVELEQLRSRLANSGELDSLVGDEVRKKEVESGRDLVIARREQLQKKIDELPVIGIKYARLQRRIAVLSKTYEILTQQYQLERITRQGEDGDYQIVDRATPIKRKVAPRNAAFAGLGAMLGLMTAALAASVLGPTRKYKKH